MKFGNINFVNIFGSMLEQSSALNSSGAPNLKLARAPNILKTALNEKAGNTEQVSASWASAEQFSGMVKPYSDWAKDNFNTSSPNSYSN